jgi:hypothetical protein
MDADVDVSDIMLQSPTTELGRTLVLNTVCLFCKLTLHALNRTVVQNEHYVRLLADRDSKTPLITVSNHTRYALGLGPMVQDRLGQQVTWCSLVQYN